MVLLGAVVSVGARAAAQSIDVFSQAVDGFPSAVLGIHENELHFFHLAKAQFGSMLVLFKFHREAVQPFPDGHESCVKSVHPVLVFHIALAYPKTTIC